MPSYADLALLFSLRISMYVWPLYVLYPTCKRWMYFAPIPLVSRLVMHTELLVLTLTLRA